MDDTITKAIKEVLEQVQEMSGRPTQTLLESTIPIGGLEGFDSLSSIEATVMIESKLGFDADCDSLFISEDGKKALTLDEVVDRVQTLLETQNVVYA